MGRKSRVTVRSTRDRISSRSGPDSAALDGDPSIRRSGGTVQYVQAKLIPGVCPSARVGASPALGEEAFHAAWQEAAAMTIEQPITYALEGTNVSLEA